METLTHMNNLYLVAASQTPVRALASLLLHSILWYLLQKGGKEKTKKEKKKEKKKRQLLEENELTVLFILTPNMNRVFNLSFWVRGNSLILLTEL